MVKVGILGPNGFVGSSLVDFLKNKAKYKLYKIDRNYLKSFSTNLKLDCLFHCANSGNKRSVNEDSINDIINSLKLIQVIKKKIITKKFILISTISARLENNSYGLNRKIIEDYTLKVFDNSLVIRLPVLFNSKQKRGILWDILNSKNIFISKSSLVNPISSLQMSRLVLSKIKHNGILEIGADKSITLGDIAKIVKSRSNFTGNKLNLLSKNYCEDAKLDILLRQIKNF